MFSLEGYSENIVKEARKIVDERYKAIDLNWNDKLKVFDDMKIFYDCSYISGIPKKEFLKRLINIRPFVRGSKHIETFENMLYESFSTLNIFQSDISDFEPAVNHLHTIMHILAVAEFQNNAKTWIKSNFKIIAQGLMNCLCSASMYLATEACYASAYMAKFLEADMPLLIAEAIIKGCMDAVSARVEAQEAYLTEFKEAKKKHDDIELYVGKDVEFLWPKFMCNSNCREYRAVNCALYTICFLFQFNKYPRLYLFFQSRIYCRKELSRLILLTLYEIIVKHLSLSAEIQENEEWKTLPSKLYYDISRALMEKNHLIKQKLNEVIHKLTEMSKVRLPAISLNMYQSMYQLQAQGQDIPTLADSKVNVGSVHNLFKINIKKNLEKELTEPVESSESQEFVEMEDGFFEKDTRYQRKSALLPELQSMILMTEKMKESESRGRLRHGISTTMSRMSTATKIS